MAPASPPKVLVVDDEPSVRRLLCDALSDAFAVEEAGNGRAALARLGDARDATELIVLDVRLPDASGFELIAELRASARQADIPVIFTTNESAVEQEAHAFRLGADDYFVKPVMIHVLIEKIGAALSRHRRLSLARSKARRQLSEPEIRRRWQSFRSDNERPNILIVDDNPADRAFLRDCLGARYELSIADCGQAALAMAAGCDARFDLVLLDVVLADMSGYDVQAALADLPATHETPVIIASARTRGTHIVNGLRRGAHDYVTKPCRPDLIDARIGHHIRRHSACRFYEGLTG